MARGCAGVPPHSLLPVVDSMAAAKAAIRPAASSCPDTRTAGGHERQKPLVLAQGFAVYLLRPNTVCLARASSALSAVCVAPISSVGHIAAKLAMGYSLLHQGHLRGRLRQGAGAGRLG